MHHGIVWARTETQESEMTYSDFVAYKKSRHAAMLAKARRAIADNRGSLAAWYLSMAAVIRRSIRVA